MRTLLSGFPNDGKVSIDFPDHGFSQASRRGFAEAVAGYLHSSSVTRRVYIDRADYRHLEHLGLSRADVERALADLESEGRIGLLASDGDVLVQLPVGRKP